MTLIGLSIGSIWASSAEAQLPLNPVDYKAAYCAGRLRDIQVPQPPAGSPTAANEMVQELANKIDHARQRLKTYLLPRLSYVDATALLATTQIGVEEEQQYERAMKQCMGKANAAGSVSDAAKIGMACANEAGWPKLKECEETTFLPF